MLSTCLEHKEHSLEKESALIGNYGNDFFGQLSLEEVRNNRNKDYWYGFVIK